MVPLKSTFSPKGRSQVPIIGVRESKRLERNGRYRSGPAEFREIGAPRAPGTTTLGGMLRVRFRRGRGGTGRLIFGNAASTRGDEGVAQHFAVDLLHLDIED